MIHSNTWRMKRKSMMASCILSSMKLLNKKVIRHHNRFDFMPWVSMTVMFCSLIFLSVSDFHFSLSSLYFSLVLSFSFSCLSPAFLYFFFSPFLVSLYFVVFLSESSLLRACSALLSILSPLSYAIFSLPLVSFSFHFLFVFVSALLFLSFSLPLVLSS